MSDSPANVKIVITYNAKDRSVEGSVVSKPVDEARQLVGEGRARYATDEEMAAHLRHSARPDAGDSKESGDGKDAGDTAAGAANGTRTKR